MGRELPRRGARSQGGPPASDAAEPDDMGPKRGAGAPKECGEEEARTCCGCRFPLLLALLQLALGIAVTVVGFLMAGISSSLLVRDTPFWAGIIIWIDCFLCAGTIISLLHMLSYVVLTAIYEVGAVVIIPQMMKLGLKEVCLVAYLGLFMLCVSYQVDERTCIQFAMKLLYFLLSAFGLMVCVLAVAFAAHHYAQLTQLTCGTALDACQCKLPSSEPLSRTFVYRDVTDCTSITGTFKLFLLIQMILNLVCGLVCLLVCFMMWKHRYQVFYVGVRMCSLTAAEGQQPKV